MAKQKICPKCAHPVEINTDGFFYDHTTSGDMSGDICPGSGEPVRGERSRYVQHVAMPPAQLTKIAFGRSFRYFIKVRGVNIRISKDLYMGLKVTVTSNETSH